MNDPLRQADEEYRVVEGCITIGMLRGTVGIVDEDEVQIGTVAELEARQLAVTNDGETGFAAIGTCAAHRPAMPLDELVVSELQGQLHNELCCVGQPVADVHQWQLTKRIGDGDSKDRGPVKLPKHIERCLDIAVLGLLQLTLQYVAKILSRRRRVEDPRIQQLVEQNRLTCKLAAQVAATAHENQQALERRRVLVQ